MAWTPRQVGLNTSDNSSFLGVWDSTADGSVIGGGASYQCNQTAMGFILDLPSVGPSTFRQSAQVFFDFNVGTYPTYTAQFSQPVLPGSLLIAIFTSIFASSLFDIAISDSTLLGWLAPYPTNGHVPGESNTLQVFLAIAVGGQPIVTITSTGFSAMTAGSLVLIEYSAGPNGTIAHDPSAFKVGGPDTLTIGSEPTSVGDLMFMAISLIQACPTPNVTPFGGGTVLSPPGPGNRIPPNTLPVISLPFCFSEKCRIFD